MSEAPVGKIYAAIAGIIKDMKGIKKDGQNQQQHWSFRSMDAMCNEVHGLLAKYGVFYCPEVCGEIRTTDGKTAKGGRWEQVLVRVRYTFYASDGSSVALEVPGSAMDFSDKACSKAMTFAHKTALLQIFCIPTEADDPDQDNPERGSEETPTPKAEEALNEKRGHADPMVASDDVKYFRSVVDKLAARDLLAGTQLTAADYKQIGQAAVAICNAKGARAIGEWLESHGQLVVDEDEHGIVGGYIVEELTPKE